uniref:Uncharacterized protein n=1 Tax=Spironucleus salmonicida TaxID=348837 RepID=V6LYK0_9EUKA|eukprot:EST45894.1 Hypothetical protein SS50377_14139 [Spironucleus salmonicida]
MPLHVVLILQLSLEQISNPGNRTKSLGENSDYGAGRCTFRVDAFRITPVANYRNHYNIIAHQEHQVKISLPLANSNQPVRQIFTNSSENEHRILTPYFLMFIAFPSKSLSPVFLFTQVNNPHFSTFPWCAESCSVVSTQGSYTTRHILKVQGDFCTAQSRSGWLRSSGGYFEEVVYEADAI